jgi:hypothetical protein
MCHVSGGPPRPRSCRDGGLAKRVLCLGDTMASEEDLIRSETLVRYPAGDGQTAVTLRRTLPPVVLPDAVAAALETLRQFRPLDRHLQIAAQSLKDPRHFALLREAMTRWAETGVLVGRGALLDAARQNAAGATGTTTLRTIGVLTCDRVDALRACVESFARNARTHGDPCRFVVGDDSTSSSTRAANVKTLAELASTWNVEIAYASVEERRLYAERLAKRAGVSLEVVTFALEGLPGCGGSIGANRNTLLLECAGEAFVSTDDDTLAELARPPQPAAGIAFTGEGDPMEYRFFRTREEALASVARVEESALRCHADVLGRSVASLVSGESDGGVDLDGATPAMLEGLRSGAGRVVATIAGSYGDSGMFAGVRFLMQWMRDRRPRYDEEAYRLAVSSREILRIAPRLTLRRAPPLMSTSVAFDHRQLLPPFLPVLRDEDGMFCETLLCCFEDAHVAHLPRAILHAAQPGRRYEPDRVRVASVRRLADLVTQYTRGIAAGMTLAGPVDRMRMLGRSIEDLGSAAPGDYLAVIRSLYVYDAALRARRLEGILRSAVGAPPAWIHDVGAHLEAQRQALPTEAYYVPWDLREGRTPEEALTLSQLILRRYGRLLGSWSQVVEGARSLREEDGIGVARRIH